MKLRPRINRRSSPVKSVNAGRWSKTSLISKKKISTRGGVQKKSSANVKRGAHAALVKSLQDALAKSLKEKRAAEKKVKACEGKIKRLETDLKAFEKIADNYGRDLECPICMELFIKPVTLNCSHTLCAGCLNKWLVEAPEDVKNTCPVCKEAVVTKPLARAMGAVLDRIVSTFSPEKVAERKAREKLHARWMKAVRRCPHCGSSAHYSSGAADLELFFNVPVGYRVRPLDSSPPLDISLDGQGSGRLILPLDLSVEGPNHPPSTSD